MHRLAIAGGLLALVGAAAPARGADLSWNGFASFYGVVPLQRDIYVDSPDRTQGRVDFTDGTRLGLNLRAELGQGWTAAVQLLASSWTLPGLYYQSDWRPRADWFYVVYNPIDGLNFRVGRQIFPNWLGSEYIDAGFIYPWRRPPSLVYLAAPLKSFNGISADYRGGVGADLDLTASLFGGNERIREDFNDAQVSVSADNVVGGTLSLDGEGWRVRTMLSRLQASATVDFGLVGVSGPVGSPILTTVSSDLVTLFTLGARYDRGGLVAYGELGLMRGLGSTIVPTTGQPFLDHLEGGYLAIGHHLGRFLPWLMVTRADWKLGFNGNNGIANVYSAGLDYRATSFAALKLHFDHQISEGDSLGLNQPGTADTVSAGVDIIF
jgi:hypothetical protein